jgi:hypothetical protein
MDLLLLRGWPRLEKLFMTFEHYHHAWYAEPGGGPELNGTIIDSSQFKETEE